MSEEETTEVKNYEADCGEYAQDLTLDLFLVGGVGVTVVSFVGIIGNGLTILVLTRPKMKSSTNTILLGLSICDLTLVTFFCLLLGFPVLFGYFRVWRDYITTIFPIYSQLAAILEISKVGSIYFTIAVTLERFLVVNFPLRVRTYCTIKNAMRTLVIILGFAVSFTLPFWWENAIGDIYVKGTWVCYQSTIPEFQRNPNYVLYFQNVAVFFVYRLIPFTLLSVLNLNIYIKVREANKSRQTMTNSESNEISIAKMLLWIVFVFLACNFIQMFNRVKEAIFGGGERNTTQIYLFFAYFLINLNSAVNFIIYCLVGEKFRRNCIELFCPRSLRRNRVGSTVTGGSTSMSTINSWTTQNSIESRRGSTTSITCD